MKHTVDVLFSAEWYLSRHPDAAGFEGGARAHYDAVGRAEGRSPHPLFDVEYYLAENPGVREAGIDPVLHYLDVGWRAMLSPHPLFDPGWYLSRNPDLLALEGDPFVHHLQKGWREGRDPHPLFDTGWYLERRPDLLDGGVEPLTHYLQAGWREGCTPHPLFAPDWYRETYALDADVDAWRNYVGTGWRKGRSPHPLFDARGYEAAYLDPVTHLREPLTHYLTDGWKEGLLPRPDAAPDPDHPDATAPGPAEVPRSGEDTAPLYRAVRAAEGAALRDRRLKDALRDDGRRGRILMVTHDMQVGGAPQVLRLFADWVRRTTRFSVGIVAIDSGVRTQEFRDVAPVFVINEYPVEARADALRDWAGPDVRAIFVNSVVGGTFYKYWHADTPSVAFVHEIGKVLADHPEQAALIRENADHVVTGGPDVRPLLLRDFGFDPDRFTVAHSYIESLPGADDARDRRERRALARAALGVPDGRLLVMGCGLRHWRKSPDIFVEVAERVLAAGIDAQFVWMGGRVVGSTGEDPYLALLAMKGLGDRVRFTGHEPDVAGKLAGGDVFMLSSEEDPFPLVALHAAQAGMPIVCFEGAGGIPGFVRSSGSGTAVPFLDVQAMADAVIAYAGDADLRHRAGEAGRDQVAAGYTVEAVGPMLLHHLRTVAGLAPEVSVVVPNYDYAAYLPERLAGIAAQTFQDFEVVLLDDASTDASPALLADFAARRPGTRLVVNDRNSGSPFAQWMRGMAMAAADLVWLAEADDACDDGLLMTLLPFYDDRNMRLASCMSVPVLADGTVAGDYRPIYLDRIAPGRWDADFTVTDHEEADRGLGIANTIPNASAVLFRKFVPEPEFAARVAGMRLCGDWYFYVRAMRGGTVGFSAAPLNRHRRHGGTVTHRLEGSPRYFDELAAIRTHIGRTYRQSAETRARVAAFLAQDAARFGIEDMDTLPQAPAPGKALPSIVVVAPDLSPGGGQMFAISLANEWAARGGRVVLLNVRSQPTHPMVLCKLSPAVALFHADEAGAALDGIVARFDIDLVHSGIWWSDRLVDEARDRLPAALPWVITMHGCHETILQLPHVDPSFPERMARMAERASAWAYTADKNLAVFDAHPAPAHLLRIPNGMREEPVGDIPSRAELGLRPDATVLCLASRAIASKGWEEAVEVVRMLNDEGAAVDLLLIGEGPCADAIGARAPAHVHPIGQVPNLQDHLAVADVGILPSSFVGESLPLVLIEMMAKSLPLVATEVGEIPDLVGRGDDAAGLLVPLRDGALDTDAFADAVRRMLDPAMRRRAGRNARARFDAGYRLDTMVDRYADLYDAVGARTWKDGR